MYPLRREKKKNPKHSFLVLGHWLSILMPQPTVKQVAASVPRAPEEPCQAAHSGPWCTLDTKLPVAGTEIKDPEEKGQMLRLRNTRGATAGSLPRQKWDETNPKKASELSEQGQNVWLTGKRRNIALSKGLFGEGGLFMWMRQCCSGTVWCLVSRTKHAFSQKTKWSEIKLAASRSRR